MSLLFPQILNSSMHRGFAGSLCLLTWGEVGFDFLDLSVPPR